MEMTVSGRLRLQPVREEPPRKGSEWKKGRKEGVAFSPSSPHLTFNNLYLHN